MYDELVKHLRFCGKCNDATECDYCEYNNTTEYVDRVCSDRLMLQAADAIEELSVKVESLQSFADNISRLPDCNTCLKNNLCEFTPKYGEYCRINCPAWLGAPEPPKEE